MSVYYLNKIFYLLDTDEAFLSRFRGDIDGALKGFRLSQEELGAVKSGDVATLYRMGAHAFLLNVLARHNLCGVNRDNYISRIQTLARQSQGVLRSRSRRGSEAHD